MTAAGIQAENERLRAENERLREALDDATSDGPGYLCSWREYEEWTERRDSYRAVLKEVTSK